jgi:hypothetical protein
MAIEGSELGMDMDGSFEVHPWIWIECPDIHGHPWIFC